MGTARAALSLRFIEVAASAQRLPKPSFLLTLQCLKDRLWIDTQADRRDDQGTNCDTGQTVHRNRVGLVSRAQP